MISVGQFFYKKTWYLMIPTDNFFIILYFVLNPRERAHSRKRNAFF